MRPAACSSVGIDAAYEIRRQAEAPKASPGTNATPAASIRYLRSAGTRGLLEVAEPIGVCCLKLRTHGTLRSAGTDSVTTRGPCRCTCTGRQHLAQRQTRWLGHVGQQTQIHPASCRRHRLGLAAARLEYLTAPCVRNSAAPAQSTTHHNVSKVCTPMLGCVAAAISHDIWARLDPLGCEPDVPSDRNRAP